MSEVQETGKQSRIKFTYAISAIAISCVMITFMPQATVMSMQPALSELTETSSSASSLAVTDPNILTWKSAGIIWYDWVKVNLDTNHSIQLGFTIIDDTGYGVSASTLDNSSISTSSITNVNTQLAYFNFTALNAGDYCNVSNKFERKADVFGEPYVLHTATKIDCDSYSKFNLTLVRINCGGTGDHASPFDQAWIVDCYTWPNQRYAWNLGDRSDVGYHAFKYPNDNMFVCESNTGNFANVVNHANYNVESAHGWIGTLVNDRTFAQKYDADGRMLSMYEVVELKEYKQRYGNVLNILPALNYDELYSVSYNDTLFEMAAEFGITHVNLETFLITPGAYTWSNASVSSAVNRIRTLVHDNGMLLILPSYWKDFVDAVGNPLDSYSYYNRVKMLNAWNNYTIHIGPLTDEYSIGYGNLGGLTWNYWNLNMMETAFQNLSDKPISIWGNELWYQDEDVVYLNTEELTSWMFDYIDLYDYPSDPCYEMMGQRTWSFDMRVTADGDSDPVWTYQNVSFELRVTEEALRHGAGISVFYNESFYSNHDGFSFAIDYCNGLRDNMFITQRDLTGTTYGRLYEDDNWMALTMEDHTGALDLVPDIEKSQPCNLIIVATDGLNDYDMTATLGSIAIVSSSPINLTVTDYSSQGIEWVVSPGDMEPTIAFTLSSLENGAYYKVYVDGIFSQTLVADGGTITFTYSGPWSEHEFEVVVWYPAGVSTLVTLGYTMLVLGVLVSIVAAVVAPLKNEKKFSPERIQRTIINIVIFTVIAMVMLGVVHQVIYG